MGSEVISLDHAPDRGQVRHRIVQQPATLKMNKRIALYPIIFFQIYLTVSVLTFAFGPMAWPVSNPWQLYTFLFLAQVGLFVGYRSAIRVQPRSASTKIRVPVMVTVSLVFNYLWIGKTYQIRTGLPDIDLGTAIKMVIAGLTSPGQQYSDKFSNYQTFGGQGTTIMDYITLLLFPVMWVAFPLGVFFWKQLSFPVRVALVGWIILDLSTWIAAGTNKGIADFVLLLPCMLVARNPAMLMKIRRRNMIGIGLITIIGVAALFTFFSMGVLGRSGGKGDLLSDAAAGVSADLDNPILKYSPSALRGQIVSFTSYFTQGYYGLSLSLKEPFVFCYGVGNSYFLEGLSRHLVSTPIMFDTYPGRIEARGWATYGKWHSIYPWIASDLSFPGTIVFMFVLGWLFAVVWLDVVFCRNPWAVCLLPLLIIMLFYIPANNQVLGFSTAAIPFWTLLFLWYFSRTGVRQNERRV